jgi:hypothetical protein
MGKYSINDLLQYICLEDDADGLSNALSCEISQALPIVFD